MWDAVRLSSFEALQFVVATRIGEDAARSLRNFSPAARLGLTRREPTGETMGAFEQAVRDLEAWCKQGAIGAHGFRVIGPYGYAAAERTDLSDYWSSDAKFNYDTSTVVLSCIVFVKVTLRKYDIEKQLGLLTLKSDAVAPRAVILAAEHRGAGSKAMRLPAEAPSSAEPSLTIVAKDDLPQKILAVLGERVASWPEDKAQPGQTIDQQYVEKVLGRKVPRNLFREVRKSVVPGSENRGRPRHPKK